MYSREQQIINRQGKGLRGKKFDKSGDKWREGGSVRNFPVNQFLFFFLKKRGKRSE